LTPGAKRGLIGRIVPDATQFHTPGEEELRDLGFGSVVARESRRRLLNRDGTFNVARRGLGFWSSLSPYHLLLTTSWTRFFALLTAGYLAVNATFGLGYFLCGPDALSDPTRTTAGEGYLRAFFFSVQTFATIGYGHWNPSGLAANLLVTAESLVGLMGFAIATGLLFARFSRPTARIRFSEVAVIAPYGGSRAFEFRIANERTNELIELEAQVLFSRLEPSEGRTIRRFHDLKLERRKVVFFPLAWTIVHPIDRSSPLFGLDASALQGSDAEFLVLLTGFDETFSERVHARSSYKADELIWGARFADVFNRPGADGRLSIDLGRIDRIDRIETG
jgi:inward rectifier potassium channel